MMPRKDGRPAARLVESLKRKALHRETDETGVILSCADDEASRAVKRPMRGPSRFVRLGMTTANAPENALLEEASR